MFNIWYYLFLTCHSLNSSLGGFHLFIVAYSSLVKLFTPLHILQTVPIIYLTAFVLFDQQNMDTLFLQNHIQCKTNEKFNLSKYKLNRL